MNKIIYRFPLSVIFAIEISNKMKIAIISHSDLLGGAAIASMRLADKLCNSGHDVSMIVVNRQGNDDIVVRAGNSVSRAVAFLSERLHIYINNGFSKRHLFKVSTGEMGQTLVNLPQIKNAELLIIGWACQGLLSLNGFAKLCTMPGKRIAVVMHDLWWMTGVCHYPFGCERYTEECGQCKFLSSSKKNDLSHKIWLKKRHIYSLFRSVKWVAVSRWVKECAAKSTLLGNADVRVVHNIFPLDDFYITPQKEVEELKPWQGRKVITLGAASLDNEVKGLSRAIDAINSLPDDWRDKVVVALYGGLSDETVLSRLNVNYVYFNRIGEDKLRELLASTDVILSSAYHETYGLTLLEGIASGAVAATFGGDGREDIVVDMVNGFIARDESPGSLSDAIVKALNLSSTDLDFRLSQRLTIVDLVDERFLDAILK